MIRIFGKSLSMILIGSFLPLHAQNEERLDPEAVQFFESKIRPVLIEHCYRCHSAETGTVRGGLAVDHRDALLSGGASGSAIVPGNLDESTLWNAINYVDYEMPPKRKLPANVIEDFRKWIEMGAPDPRIKTGTTVHSKVTSEVIEEGKKFWSYSPPSVVAPKSSPWAKTHVDQYIAQEWEKHQLTPADDVTGDILVRRLFNDLVGVPPSVEERSAFRKAFDKNPDQAVETLVDDLLTRTQFGERWGRYWLDVVRYAETTGKEIDFTYSQAWRYRDFVIDSFNRDKPYDQFLRQQIAGDLLKVKTDEEWAENLIATGFLALGPKSLNEQNPRQFRADVIDEQIDATTRAILGVSVSCARCHDHKFDPISQEDYYALAGIFQSTETCFGGSRSLRNRQPSRLIVLPINDVDSTERPISKSELAKLKSELKQAEDMYVEARRAQRQGNANQRNGFLNVALLDQVVGQTLSKISRYDENGQPQSLCMGVQDAKQIRPSRLLVRGEIDQPAQEVPRGFVQVLRNGPVNLPKTSSGRLELAEWLSSRENPLTARVMVNRIWQHLIGNGIVRETDNFGMSGPAPTHKELLDYLAIRFMEQNWSVKSMVREIANSRTYRLSSKFDAASLNADPDNHYLARGNARRLDAEAMRDSMLAISQQIDWKRPKASIIANFGEVALGPNGPISLPANALASLTSGKSDFSAIAKYLSSVRGGTDPFNAPTYCRSVYLPIARNSLPRALDVFDFAEPSLIIGAREVSNTPEQALYMLNSSFVIEQSDALARLIIKQASNQPARARIAFDRVLGRYPSDKEAKAIETFFRTAEKDTSAKSRDQAAFQALSQFCQTLFCSAEFRFIE